MRILRLALIALLTQGCVAPPVSTVPSVVQAHESAVAGWHELPLPGKTATRYTHLSEQGRHVVHAESNSSASMLRRNLNINPAGLGAVKFSWRVPELIESADLADRHAADSPVRLILAFDGDHGRLSLRNRMLFDLAHAVTGEAPPYATLMYVWDNRAPAESVIHSGRTDRVRKIVLESGASNLGVWLHYERDVVADYRRSFGEDPGRLIAVGLMTDSDNTQSRARAWYGEVRLIGPDGRLH